MSTCKSALSKAQWPNFRSSGPGGTRGKFFLLRTQTGSGRNFSKSVGGDEKVRDTGKNLCYAQGR